MKIFKGMGIIAVVMFSFYYTERIANFVLEKNNLYQEIESKKSIYEVESVAATINDETMIPGLYGKSVNVKTSYYNMKSLQTFNSYYLVYQDTVPEVSMEHNKDKIIMQGNSGKNSVALVLEYDQKIIDYLKNYKFSVLVDMNTFHNTVTYEQINNEVNDFQKLESLINKYASFNPNLCVLNGGNEKVCRAEKKYLIKPNKELSDSTYLELKDNIHSGDIVLIKKNTKLSNIEVVVKSILYKDYDLNYLSQHISEEQ